MIKHIARTLLGVALAYAGITHLTTNRTEFLAQVPTWLPLDADFVVIASGVVEIILGLSLILLIKYQIQIGWNSWVNSFFFQYDYPLLCQ